MKQGKGAHSQGLLSRDDRKISQGFVDVKKLTVVQLEELIERQNKLLQNRSFLAKLPDKGKRILNFKTELELEKKKKQEECDEACRLMLGLNLNDRNPEDLEWNQGELNKINKQLDSDDDDDEAVESNKDEIDPLKLLATHSGTASGKNIKLNFCKSGISNESSKSDSKLLYVDKFCEKYGQLNNHKEKFKPNQLKNNDKTLFVTSAERVKKRLGNKWEVTEATPPVPVYKNVMMISLSESLKLQKEQAEKLREIEQKHAIEKLLQNTSMKMGNKLPVNNTTEYRNAQNVFEESVEDIETENSDSDSDDKNTVNFLVGDNDLNT